MPVAWLRLEQTLITWSPVLVRRDRCTLFEGGQAAALLRSHRVPSRDIGHRLHVTQHTCPSLPHAPSTVHARLARLAPLLPRSPSLARLGAWSRRRRGWPPLRRSLPYAAQLSLVASLELVQSRGD